MKKTLLSILYIAPLCLTSLLSGCSEAEKPPAIVIDNTPIEALEVGGAIGLLKKPNGTFDSPNSEHWREAQEYEIALNLAPPVHNSITLRYDPETPPIALKIRAASDDKHIYLRLRWPDLSENTINSRELFSDGAAVQFALNGGEATSFMMGATPTPVNIWYWKASEKLPQNLAAGGFGSTTKLPLGDLKSSHQYRDNGEWTVVLSRAIKTSGEYQVDLSQAETSIALALWQGDSKQRDGLKHVSFGWVTLK